MYSLPHTSGTLTGTGRSIKGVSDVGNPFQDFSETISAFNETLVVEKADDEFFNQGLDPNIYPGFSSPTRSKTKLTIDLSPSEETRFGYTNSLASGPNSTNLSLYFNTTDKRIKVYKTHLIYELFGKKL